MKMLLALSLLLSLPAGAQTYDHTCAPNRDQPCVAGGIKSALACGKYEHNEAMGGLAQVYEKMTGAQLEKALRAMEEIAKP